MGQSHQVGPANDKVDALRQAICEYLGIDEGPKFALVMLDDSEESLEMLIDGVTALGGLLMWSAATTEILRGMVDVEEATDN